MINSSVFNYINVLDKAADASWMRNDAIANNIANATTPYYKRQDVSFENELKKALGHDRSQSMDEKVAGLRDAGPEPVPYTDYENFSYRLDKNNVDIENENVMLAENQLKYQGLLISVNQEFANLQAVMK